MSTPHNVSDLGANLSYLCFPYPQQGNGRKHGPKGYTDYESYRDWLRDEFCFRCAYCLMRENWLRGRHGFQIDHCIPESIDHDLKRGYDNLVYSCPWCNRAKSGVKVPNPTEFAYGKAMNVDAQGRIKAKNELGSLLIDGLWLDRPEITHHRMLILRVVRLAEEKNDVLILHRLLGFPEDLPDLKRKRPPGGNTRPAGIQESCFEKQQRCDLPHIY